MGQRLQAGKSLAWDYGSEWALKKLTVLHHVTKFQTVRELEKGFVLPGMAWMRKAGFWMGGNRARVSSLVRESETVFEERTKLWNIFGKKEVRAFNVFDAFDDTTDAVGEVMDRMHESRSQKQPDIKQ